MIENKYYERKIKYLDLMDNGERAGGAGFIKMEVKGMEISLSVNVKGLHPTDTYEREVMLQTDEGEFTAGKIALKGGQGVFQYHLAMDYSRLQGIRIILGGAREICCKWQEKKPSASVKNVVQESLRQEKEAADSAGQMADEKQRVPKKPREIQLIPWDEIRTVEESLERVEKIMSKSAEGDAWKAAEKAISAGKSMIGKEAPEEVGNAASGRRISAEGSRAGRGLAAEGSRAGRELAAEGSEAGKELSAERSEAGKEVPAGRDVKTGKPEKGMSPERASTAREAGERKNAAGSGRGMEGKTASKGGVMWENTAKQGGRNMIREKKPVRLMEDKWQQIWAIYPHIRPFQDEREYLSISPADFVLLPDESYRAANNSFLLHGYYNYDHLILTRLEKRGEISYYIGVPGNYYEREKQVAVMFGFESFECGTEPAQAGDFGYYMMRTQL